MTAPRTGRRAFLRAAGGAIAATAASTASLTALAGCAGADGSGARPAGRRPRVLIVGAGMAGLAAARELRRNDIDVLVLEARTRIGGRVAPRRALGTTLDLGAAWIHDVRGNPLTALADRAGLARVPTDWERLELRAPGGARVPVPTIERAAALADDLLARVADAADGAPDTPVQQVLDDARALRGMRGLERATTDWLLGLELPLDLAADPRAIGPAGFDEGDTYRGGGDAMVRGGTGQLVRALARGTRVQLGAPVRTITQRGGDVTVTTTDGTRHRGDACIVTLPLGVLKAGDVTFDPPLPAEAGRAIDGLAVGLLDKVILRYAERAWPSGATLGVVGAPLEETIAAVDLHHVTGEPIVAAFIGGGYAAQLERRGATGMQRAVTAVLARGFGDDARAPEDAVVTRWLADPYARGAYSYVPVGASTDLRAALHEPSGRVLLAGEHTSSERPATMDGALRSGQSAARRAAELLG